MALIRTIVVPAFNEERRIATTLDCLLQHYGEGQGQTEILVVDDGSTDRTSQVVNWYHRKEEAVNLLRVPHGGKGAAVRQGVAHAQGDFVFLCDADLKEGVSQLDKLESALRGGADVAIGSRWVAAAESTESQPLFRRICSRIFNLCAHRLLGLQFKDTQCGLKAFTNSAAHAMFQHQSIDGWGFDPELLLIASRFGYDVAEVPIELPHDYTTSRFRPIRDGITTFKELFAIVLRDAAGAYPSAQAARSAKAATVAGSPELPQVASSGQEAA
ncbi:MAG: dolichyl-phosphate beta-glucosyltransferase [Terriglobales bacterium]